MKKQSLILIIFILLNTFSHSTEINVAIGKAKVIDGDTIVINGEKIRFGGIDTPERNKIGHNFSKIKKKKIR